MDRASRVLILLLPAIIACRGQVTVTSVADAASFGPRVSPGSLATIFGANLASGPVQATDIPLPTSLAGTSVAVQGTPVPLIYVSATQINFQVPTGVKGGANSLVVHAPGGSSAIFNFVVAIPAPGIFQYGSGHAVAQNGDTDHTLNSSTVPAASGSVITVYLTGQGPLDNAVKDGNPAPSSPISKATATATATIGPQNAPIQFLGLTPGFAGLAQANIQVPNLPNGDYPLAITVGGIVSASAVVSVSGSGAPFTSPLVLTGTASFPNTVVSNVAVLGNTAYVCGTNRITAVDVGNPAQPSVIGEFGDNDLQGNGKLCAINSTAGNPYLVEILAPLNSPTSFAVYDLTNPRVPNRLGVTATPYTNIANLSFSGTFGFSSTYFFTFNQSNGSITAQNGDFLVFDFTNPAQPRFIAAVQPNSLQAGSSNLNLKPWAAVVNQNFAYIASSTATGSSINGAGALDVISIASPFAPVAVNQITTSQAAIFLSFDFSGNTLLVCGNTTGNRNPGNPDFAFTGNLTVTTMDASNVQSPAVLTSFNTGLQVNGTFHTVAFTNGVFAIVNNPPANDNGGPGSLMIVDARAPRNPVLYPVENQFGFSKPLPTSGGYLLAGTLHGLNVYKLQIQ